MVSSACGHDVQGPGTSLCDLSKGQAGRPLQIDVV